MILTALLAKIHEQLDITEHLIGLLPPDRLDWAPADSWPVGILLGHLLDCMAGFCAVLATRRPEQLRHFSTLRDLPVNHRCTPEEAVQRIAIYRAHIDEGFALLTDVDLAQPVQTVFVKQGEPVMTLLLGNLEHLINHKYQLFAYLKQMGVSVSTRDLYRFRE